MFRSLVRNLVLNSSIETTDAKAKTISRMIDKVFTKAKKDTLSSKRSLLAVLGNDHETFEKIFSYKSLLSSKSSGFAKRTKLNRRRGDNTLMVKLELATPKDEVKEEKQAVKEKKSS